VADGVELFEPVLVGALEWVARLPVGCARRGFHDEKRLAVLHRAVLVVAHRNFAQDQPEIGLRSPRRINVVGDEIADFRHFPVIEPFKEAHHIGGGRDVRGELLHRVDFELHEVAALNGGEPHPVERVALRAAPGGDLIPVGVGMAPEGVAPGAVEGFERSVTLLQPFAELRNAEVAMAAPAVFVGDVPGGEGGVVAVAFRQLRVDLCELLPIDGGAPAMIVPPMIGFPEPVFIHPADFRMRLCQPGGFRAARRGEDDVKLMLGHAVHDPVEPVEMINAGSRLERGPTEDSDGKRVASGFFHQLEVAVDDLRGVEPLIRVIISAVEHFHRVPDDWTILLHCHLPAWLNRYFL